MFIFAVFQRYLNTAGKSGPISSLFTVSDLLLSFGNDCLFSRSNKEGKDMDLLYLL